MILKSTHLYKMLCLDIDGTLINDDKNISETTKAELIRVISSYDIQLILVSSRMPESMNLIARQINSNQPIICYNGALILSKFLEFNKRDILFNAFISIKDTDKILKYALKSALHIGIFRFNEWYVNNIDYWADREIRGTKITPKVSNLENIINGWRNDSIGLHKIMLREVADKLDSAEEFLRQNFLESINIHRNKETVLEITPNSVSKASGIKFLCTELNIKSDEVMAFGDSYNDSEMLEYAGLGVAMGNSPEAIKKIANVTTSTNNENGIAVILKSYFP